MRAGVEARREAPCRQCRSSRGALPRPRSAHLLVIIDSEVGRVHAQGSPEIRGFWVLGFGWSFWVLGFVGVGVWLDCILALTESLPDYVRQSDDGLYKAIDIYLEAHPFVSETDATRLFNYHKLGAETCKAASQNPRFPPSFAIQVALVQQSHLKTSEGSFRSDKSYSPLKNASSRLGQQIVVLLQCSSFEFTLRQEKKKHIKKVQPRLEIQKLCKHSRVDMPEVLVVVEEKLFP